MIIQCARNRQSTFKDNQTESQAVKSSLVIIARGRIRKDVTFWLVLSQLLSNMCVFLLLIWEFLDEELGLFLLRLGRVGVIVELVV